MTNDDGQNPQGQGPSGPDPSGQGSPAPDPSQQWGQQPPQYGAGQPPQYGAGQSPQYGAGQSPQYGADQPPQYGSPSAPQYGSPNGQGVPSGDPYTSGQPDMQGQQPYPGQQGQPGQPGQMGDFAQGQQPIAGITQEPKKSHKKLIIGICIAVVAVIVIIALIVVFAVVSSVRSQKAEEAAAAKAQDEWKAGITAPVQGYLDALADGDAEKALTFLDKDDVGEPSELMTNDALAASNKKAPIEDVDVPDLDPEYDESPFEVPASFTMGGKKVSITFYVDGPKKPETGETASDDPFTIEFQPATVPMADELADVGATVNGVKLKSGEYTVLPGAYTYALPNKNLTLDGEKTTVFTGEDISSAGVSVKLSDDGKKAAKDAASKAIDKCIKSNKLKGGCGLTLPKKLGDGTKLKEGSIKRSLNDAGKKAIKDADVTLDYEHPAKATVNIYATVKVTGDSDQGKGEILSSESNYIDQAEVDLSGDTVKVTGWK
jgi:hypothetical protein